MLNQVLIEGYMADSYVFKKDLFVRIACYRDPTAPVKPARHLGENKEEPDYVYVRFIDGHKNNLSFQRGSILRIQGMIASRTYNETLEQFLEKSYKNNMPKDLSVEIVAGIPRQVMCGRTANEILAYKHEVLEKLNDGLLKAPQRTIFKVSEMVSPTRKAKITAAANTAVAEKTGPPSAQSPSPAQGAPASDAIQPNPSEKKKHKPAHRSQPKKNTATPEKGVAKTE